MKLIKCFFFMGIGLSIHARVISQQTSTTLDELAIEIEGASREMTFTNMQTGLYSTETKATNESAAKGWYIASRKMLQDYSIVCDGQPLARSEVTRVVAYPYQFKRFYSNGVQETVTLLDSLNCMIVQLDSASFQEVRAYPLFSDSYTQDDFVSSFDKNIMVITQKNHTERTKKENYPASVAISWANEFLWCGGFYDTASIERSFAPCFINTVNPAPQHMLVMAVGDSADDARKQLRFVAKHYDSLIAVCKEHVERLLRQSCSPTGNPLYDKSIAWATLSMDALAMVLQDIRSAGHENQKQEMMDVSLPGALLVRGTSAESKEIFRSFAAQQDTDFKSAEYGRIPRLTPEPSVHSLDISPWYTLTLFEYFTYANDTTFLKEMYQTVKRSIEGKLKYHTNGTDKHINQDASTAIWYKQLGVGVEIARVTGDMKSAGYWSSIQKKTMRKASK
jgi:hypothetical protein